jgi:Ni,Fe-hydrogenase maturation factor
MSGSDLLAAKRGSSVHELAVADLVSALFLVAARTQEIVVLGVQPANTDWGATLSGEVEAALAALVDAAVAQLHLWNDSRNLHLHAQPSASTPAPSPQRSLSATPEEGGF